MKMTNRIDEMNREMESKFKKLLKANPKLLDFLKFLALRERITPVSDVSQMISYIKADGFHLERTDVVEILKKFEDLGIGRLNESGSVLIRLKFYWNLWLFPIFDDAEKPNQLLYMEVKSLAAVKNRYEREWIRRQIKSYRENFLLGCPRDLERPDMVFVSEPKAKSLTQSDLKDAFANLSTRISITLPFSPSGISSSLVQELVKHGPDALVEALEFLNYEVFLRKKRDLPQKENVIPATHEGPKNQ